MQDNDSHIQLNYIDNDSIDSLDDFQTSTKYITYNPSTNRLGIVNPKVNIDKKNTRMSSNNDEDNESDNNINDIHENKSSNNIHIHPAIKDDLKLANKKEKNKIGNLNINEINQMFTSPIKHSDNNSYSRKLHFSENKKRINEDDELNLNIQLTEENGGYSSDINKSKKDKDKDIDKEDSSYSPGKKRKKKILVLEEKRKNKSNNRKSLYANKDKTDKKENKEEKILRRDKNGVPICKKNKKKVKISFERPFANITPIVSYKEYNIIFGIPKEENFGSDECQCCSIF